MVLAPAAPTGFLAGDIKGRGNLSCRSVRKRRILASGHLRSYRMTWRALIVIGYEKASISRNYFRGEASPLPRATARTPAPARNMKMLGRRGNGANPEGVISSLRRRARSLRP